MPQPTGEDIFSAIGCKEPQISQLRDPFFEKKGLEISMLRLDEIHPVVSGNKLFKLIYFLKEAKESVSRTIITFGGAYSNHLAATAFACEKLKLNCVGIVRGEKHKALSHTLVFCRQHGMQLEFISRSSYRKTDNFSLNELANKYGDHVLIPEGGFSVKGKEGAALINNYWGSKNFSHVCLPVGTATTFAGIVGSNKRASEILGFGVLKNFHDLGERFKNLEVCSSRKYSFIGDYHFGGYAKKTVELISFMTWFYSKQKVPLDFVYTAKMMFGIYDLAVKNYFLPGSQIICIHTGGLQGNDSLPKGLLNY